MKPIRFLLLLLLVCAFLVSCSNPPTYTEQNIVSGMQSKLKEQFDLDAYVKWEGTNLATCITVPGFFTDRQKGGAIAAGLMQSLMHAYRIVLLNTDADIRFYQINIRDDEAGLDLVLVQYVRDLRMVMIGAISRFDFGDRRWQSAQPNLAGSGSRRVRNFFHDLGDKKPEYLLRVHFDPNIQSEKISSQFVSWLWESAMKLNVGHEILDMRMKAVSQEHSLFYCRVLERYEAKPGFEDFPFQGPGSHEKKYLLEINAMEGAQGAISMLLDMEDLDPRQQARLDDLVQEYGAPESWPQEDFYVLPLTFETFLAGQMATRMQMAILELGPPSGSAAWLGGMQFSGVQGDYQDRRFEFTFFYRIDVQEGALSHVPERDLEAALKAAYDVCRKYHLDDFEGFRIRVYGGDFVEYPSPSGL